MKQRRNVYIAYWVVCFMLMQPVIISASSIIPRKVTGSKWNSTPCTVTFNFDEGSDAERNAVTAAMNVWNGVKYPNQNNNTDLVILNLSKEIDTNNDIYFDDRLGYYGEFGETFYTHETGSSTILKSVDIELNSTYTRGTEGKWGHADIQTIVGHELGHALGVAHCHRAETETEPEEDCFSATCSNNLMKPKWKVGEVCHSLSSYDISSYQLIYY